MIGHGILNIHARRASHNESADHTKARQRKPPPRPKPQTRGRVVNPINCPVNQLHAGTRNCLIMSPTAPRRVKPEKRPSSQHQPARDDQSGIFLKTAPPPQNQDPRTTPPEQCFHSQTPHRGVLFPKYGSLEPVTAVSGIPTSAIGLAGYQEEVPCRPSAACSNDGC